MKARSSRLVNVEEDSRVVQEVSKVTSFNEKTEAPPFFSTTPLVQIFEFLRIRITISIFIPPKLNALHN